MEWYSTVIYIVLSILYTASWTGCSYGIHLPGMEHNETAVTDYTTTQEYYTEIVTEFVTYIERDLTTEKPDEESSELRPSPFVPPRSKFTTPKGVYPGVVPNKPYIGGDVGLWVAIAVICIAAIIVVIFLLATVVLRWRRSDGRSYDVERDENEHTNPAYEAGEIAGLEPSNGMKEVRIGLTTFADEDSKSVL